MESEVTSSLTLFEPKPITARLKRQIEEFYISHVGASKQKLKQALNIRYELTLDSDSTHLFLEIISTLTLRISEYPKKFMEIFYID